MVDTRHQKESKEERRSSSENYSSNSSQSRVTKEEILSDDQNSIISDINPRSLRTRSKIRRLERRKAYSSHSSAVVSDRKTKSEPIIITIDSDSDDNVSILSSRPNRTARIRGELIRKLSGASTGLSSFKTRDYSSSSECESEKKASKKKSKKKSHKVPLAHSSKGKKYFVNKIACKPRLRIKKHRRSSSQCYTPHKKPKDVVALRKNFYLRKRESSKRTCTTVIKKPQPTSIRSERRSLRSTSTETTVDNPIKSESVESELNTDKIEDDVKSDSETSKEITLAENKKHSRRNISESAEIKKDIETINSSEISTILDKEPEKKYTDVKENEEIKVDDNEKIKDHNEKIKVDDNEKIKDHNEKIKGNDSEKIKEDDNAKIKDDDDEKIKEDDNEKIKEDDNEKIKDDDNEIAKVNKEKTKDDDNSIKVNETTAKPPNSHSEKVKKIKKKIKVVDKIVRKRGRPRLDSKPVKVIPDYQGMRQIPFVQTSFCFSVAPKLPKCRECRIAMQRSNKFMSHAYCRFMEYRKLCYSKSGIILNAGFSEPSDADPEHLSQWLPQLHDPPKDLNCSTSKALLEHVGDQFCDLILQEKEALSLHIGKDRIMTWKRIVQGVREMCDVCYTTLFNIHWVCPICGLAVCIDCYKGRKQGITVEDEDRPKNRDQYNWLLCSLRQPHDPEKLVMAQIIPGKALWHMRDLLHKARKKWNIPSYCKCNPQEVTTPDKYISTGICKQLMSFVTKSFSNDRSNICYSGDSGIHNSEITYDDLDIEVTGGALKWLEGALNSNNLDSLKHADDYFNSYEDFANLRGNLLNGIEDDSVTSESEHDFTSFSLDDIIDCVTKPQNINDKENSGKNIIKHFSNRYPQANSGRDPLPIRIYTKLESNLAFSDVPHSWFCNGRLLFLQKSDHKENLALFQEQWKRGQPILVKGVHEKLNMDLWHPDAFCQDFGEVKNDLVDCRTGAIIKNLPMKRFWEGFECFSKRMRDDDGEYLLLKLKDWPPGEDFSEMLPKRFQDLMNGLPLPEYTHRDGILNLAGRLPSWFVRPDLGPKMYNAYGSALYPTKGTTNLHLDISDAVNVMVYVGIPSDGNAQLHIEEALKAIDEGGCDSLMRARVRARGAKPGALWHIYNARDADKIRELLTKVAIERGEKLEAHHDPIHDQSWYLDAELRKRLYRDYGVEGYAIAQCLGDAVFIPAGAPHQVRNLHSCIKIAEDFVSPENIAHCFKLTQEFRHLSDTHTNHEDKLQIKNIIYHVVRDALAHLLSDNVGPES